MGDEVMRYADAAMYRRDAMPAETAAPGGGRRPSVRLLNATPDPLGGLAALVAIYRGKVIRSLGEVTDDERRAAFTDMLKTELSGPLESIVFHFLVEGVSRAFTHQAVRNRFTFFAQESLRFAVADGEDWVSNSAYPPSLARDPLDDAITEPSGYTHYDQQAANQREVWDDAIITAQQSYQRLIDAGVPAEDARGLMPHALTTRYHWIVNYRALLTEAGKRLCTQAQFEWRLMMAEVARSLRSHETPHPDGGRSEDGWQFEVLADQLRPVCYAAGRCTFMSSFDRNCSIRHRVDRFAANQVPSTNWDTTGQWDVTGGLLPLVPIRPDEWLLDPNAAR